MHAVRHETLAQAQQALIIYFAEIWRVHWTTSDDSWNHTRVLIKADPSSFEKGKVKNEQNQQQQGHPSIGDTDGVGTM